MLTVIVGSRRRRSYVGSCDGTHYSIGGVLETGGGQRTQDDRRGTWKCADKHQAATDVFAAATGNQIEDLDLERLGRR